MTNPDTYALIESLWLEAKLNRQTPQSTAWLSQVEEWLQRNATGPWPWSVSDSGAIETVYSEPSLRTTS